MIGIASECITVRGVEGGTSPKKGGEMNEVEKREVERGN
jgi:hypothetical protein